MNVDETGGNDTPHGVDDASRGGRVERSNGGDARSFTARSARNQGSPLPSITRALRIKTS